MPTHTQEAHVSKLKEGVDAGGDASLQNGLDLAVASLKSVPPYGHREVCSLPITHKLLLGTHVVIEGRMGGRGAAGGGDSADGINLFCHGQNKPHEHDMCSCLPLGSQSLHAEGMEQYMLADTITLSAVLAVLPALHATPPRLSGNFIPEPHVHMGVITKCNFTFRAWLALEDPTMVRNLSSSA